MDFMHPRCEALPHFLPNERIRLTQRVAAIRMPQQGPLTAHAWHCRKTYTLYQGGWKERTPLAFQHRGRDHPSASKALPRVPRVLAADLRRRSMSKRRLLYSGTLAPPNTLQRLCEETGTCGKTKCKAASCRAAKTGAMITILLSLRPSLASCSGATRLWDPPT